MATECSKILKGVLKEHGWTITDLARFLERPPATVWGWVTGDTTPLFETQLEIYQKLGLIDKSIGAVQEISLIGILGSVLRSAEPIIIHFLAADSQERARLRNHESDLLAKFQLYFRALPSEDAREKILKEFPELIETQVKEE